MKSEQALPNAFFVSVPTMTPSGSFDRMIRMIGANGSASTSGTGAVGTSSMSLRARFWPLAPPEEAAAPAATGGSAAAVDMVGPGGDGALFGRSGVFTAFSLEKKGDRSGRVAVSFCFATCQRREE